MESFTAAVQQRRLDARCGRARCRRTQIEIRLLAALHQASRRIISVPALFLQPRFTEPLEALVCLVWLPGHCGSLGLLFSFFRSALDRLAPDFDMKGALEACAGETSMLLFFRWCRHSFLLTEQ